MDFGDITTENKDEIEMQAAVQKAQASLKVKEEVKKRTGGGIEAEMAKKAKEAEKQLKEMKKQNKVSKKDVNSMYAAMDQAQGGGAKKIEKQRQDALVKIRLYKTLLPDYCKDVGKIPANATLESLNAILDGIRGNLSLKQLMPQAVITAKYVATGMEQLQKKLIESGIDPLGIGDITGLADLIERHPDALQTELTEVAIELNGLLRHNCYTRLIFKMILLGSLARSGKMAAASSPGEDPMEDLAKKFADL